MIALVTTADVVKLGAISAVLKRGGVAFEVFDAASAQLWGSFIPSRLMVDGEDADRARRLLREAGFAEAADGDWDLRNGGADA
jgi:hypothetical protein